MRIPSCIFLWPPRISRFVQRELLAILFQPLRYVMLLSLPQGSGAPTTEIDLLTVVEARSPRSRCHGVGSSGGLSPWLADGSLLRVSSRGPPSGTHIPRVLSSSYKDSGPLGVGPTPTDSFYLNSLFKDSTSKYSHALSFWQSGLDIYIEGDASQSRHPPYQRGSALLKDLVSNSLTK